MIKPVNLLRLGLAAALLYFVVDALRSDLLGSLKYFSYTGSLVGALVLLLVVFRRVDERHLVLPFSMATIIHLVYIGLLVGPEGILHDLRTGGLLNLVLHYLPPYVLLLDLAFLSEGGRQPYRDAFRYLLVPVAYLGYVAIYGHYTSAYPYFFLNVDRLGFGVVPYVAGMAVAFVGLNLLVIAAKRRRLATAPLGADR
jgi:hypothetical protein